MLTGWVLLKFLPIYTCLKEASINFQLLYPIEHHAPNVTSKHVSFKLSSLPPQYVSHVAWTLHNLINSIPTRVTLVIVNFKFRTYQITII
jgi:hypothetical protein